MEKRTGVPAFSNEFNGSPRLLARGDQITLRLPTRPVLDPVNTVTAVVDRAKRSCQSPYIPVRPSLQLEKHPSTRSAFQLLHRHYPDSRWASKGKVWYKERQLH
jgi:hypothetical protein